MFLVVLMLIILLLLSMGRSEETWIAASDGVDDRVLGMHALVVKDEHVAALDACRTPADEVTKTRYYMCSGVVASDRHVLTSASCINKALINEYEVHADAGVLIGPAAASVDSHLIKILHYEIHPRYTPDPNSIKYAKHNLAVLTLACRIESSQAVVPRLPSKPSDVIGHLCSKEACNLFTVIEQSDNHHVIRQMKTKHVPRIVARSKPTKVNSRDGEDKFGTNSTSLNLLTRNLHKNSKRQISMNSSDHQPESTVQKYTMEKVNVLLTNNLKDIKRHANTSESNSGQKDSGLTNFVMMMKGPQGKRADDISKSVTIDWSVVGKEILNNNVSDVSREKLVAFVKNSISEILTKLLETMAVYMSDLDNVFPHLQNILENTSVTSDKLGEKISDLMGKILLKLALKKMELLNSVEKPAKIKTKPCGAVVSEDPKPASEDKDKMTLKVSEAPKVPETNVIIRSNVNCPPLGSPIIVNDTVIALIAYTCDDMQDWVEWKYVNVVRNIKWIQNELKRNTSEVVDNVSSYTTYNQFPNY